MAALKKHNIRQLDEDGLLNLIATREPVVDEKMKAKMDKDMKRIKQQAAELQANLKAEKVKKNSIEAKIKEIAEKCKTQKVWVLKPQYQASIGILPVP